MDIRSKDMKVKELRDLLQVTLDTAEHELTCEESGEVVHRYVEFRVSNTGELPEDLKLVQQHLSICPPCMEVVEAVIAAVRAERSAT